MSKLDGMSRRRVEAHRKLLALDSKVYKAFLGMERANYADGALTKKSKELIAIGISVVINCESCMQWLLNKRPRRALRREVLEAVEVGIRVSAATP
jgi:alkylhydroperoxidase/carboxymuconolactone decarboxylase family protein YurZ